MHATVVLRLLGVYLRLITSPRMDELEAYHCGAGHAVYPRGIDAVYLAQLLCKRRDPQLTARSWRAWIAVQGKRPVAEEKLQGTTTTRKQPLRCNYLRRGKWVQRQPWGSKEREGGLGRSQEQEVGSNAVLGATAPAADAEV